jgi:hypothetical protein
MASAVYGRWWQLETWLRSLVYVELRSAFGANWEKELPPVADKRRAREREVEYMETPDAQAHLAYTDASGLFDIIDRHWGLFEGSLIGKAIWAGRVEELLHIRNRIGHCRRPHPEDLSRVEQLLRDLERGAFRALSAFNLQDQLLTEHQADPLYNAWIAGEHETASRLTEHARRQYKTTFQLYWSRRPWCPSTAKASRITGQSGHVWHAKWFFRGDQDLDLRGFWKDVHSEGHSAPILLVCSHSSSALDISFPAVEDPGIVADAIGFCFDAALDNIIRGRRDENEREDWSNRNEDLDARVQAPGPWAVVERSMEGVSIFGA